MQNSSDTKYNFIFVTCMIGPAHSRNVSALYMHRTQKKMFVNKLGDRSS